MRKILRASASICAVLVLSACTSMAPLESRQTAGFLTDYSGLKARDTDSDAQAWQWVSPNLETKQYRHLQIQVPVFYPQPTTSDQVSVNALNDLRGALNEAARQTAFATGIPLVDSPGPQTLVLRSALTSVALHNKAFKLRELLPIKLVWSAAEMALGDRDRDVTVLLEYELLDAQSREVLVRGVRQDDGVPVVNNRRPLSMKNAQPVLENLVKDMGPELERLKRVFVTP